MSIYIIGDVQGCYNELRELLTLIKFDVTKDRLGFVGDLVNRGPHSLEVLRFIKSLPSPMVVLGNHDLYLLSLGYEVIPADRHEEHTLHTILEAPDKMEILEWLRSFPLIHYEKNYQALLVHAGIPAQWSISESINYANEVSAALQTPHFIDYLTHLFGNQPEEWNNTLKKQMRLRYITNAFTRMRFCDSQGSLDIKGQKRKKGNNDYKPWFEWRNFKKDKINIFFGHWAALNGQSSTKHCYALDTGCVWGRCLTAIDLETQKRFSVPCHYQLTQSN